MGRRDESTPRFGGRSAPRFDNDALSIHWDRVRSHIGQRQLSMGQWVAGVFDPYLVTRAHQHPDCNIDGVLGAGSNDNLLGLTADCARSLQILGKGLSQFHQTARVGVTQMLRSERTGREVGQLPPDFGRTGVDQSSAGVKRQPLGVDLGSLKLDDGQRRSEIFSCRTTAPLRQFDKVGEIAANKSARSRPRNEVTFSQQLFVRCDDRGARRT